MISAISKVITNPTLVNVAQSADATMATKTTVNAIGRPGFIIIDKNIDSDTKKFAATKEFMYQASCLAIYMALIVPVFKAQAFKLAKNHLYKEMKSGKAVYEGGFEKFKSAKEFLDYRKFADKTIDVRKELLAKDKNLKKFNHDGLREDLLNNKNVELYPKIKGSIEFGSILGSICGLSILAPQVCNMFINPVLKLMGLKKKEKTPDKVDVKA